MTEKRGERRRIRRRFPRKIRRPPPSANFLSSCVCVSPPSIPHSANIGTIKHDANEKYIFMAVYTRKSFSVNLKMSFARKNYHARLRSDKISISFQGNSLSAQSCLTCVVALFMDGQWIRHPPPNSGGGRGNVIKLRILGQNNRSCFDRLSTSANAYTTQKR